MINPINWALTRNRITLLILVFLVISGVIAYIQIPKEANPDISIPVGYVSMSLDGISPSDAERMLIKPMEQELKDIEGLDHMTSNAYHGGGSIVVNFETDIDIDTALDAVRNKISDVMGKLPNDAKRPTVKEVNLSLQPILVISISGEITEQALLTVSKNLKSKLETLEEVLEVRLRGNRDEVIEIIIDPILLQSYDLSLVNIVKVIRDHNQIIPAGALDTGSGRFSIELPSLLQEVDAIADLPLLVHGKQSVRLKDIASVHRTFRDYSSYARINGKPSLTLEIIKRSGKNVIVTSEKIQTIVNEFRQQIPTQVYIDIRQDESKQIRDMLNNLQNNIISAVILMIILLIASLGVRGGILVSAAIPTSFVCGILFLYTAGYTINMVVLFALILSVGILTDAAIVVTEYADRRILQGINKQVAYAEAANQMSFPIISSTLTTILAFLPLMFWPNIVGEFMRYLPITMIAVLSGSLIVALLFLPVIGAHFSSIIYCILVLLTGSIIFLLLQAWIMPTITIQLSHLSKIVIVILLTIALSIVVFIFFLKLKNYINSLIGFNPSSINSLLKNDKITIFGHGYRCVLSIVLRYPIIVTLFTILILGGSYLAYFFFGKGIEFFPDVEPKYMNITIHARGNLSIREQDMLVHEVETRIIDLERQHNDFDSIYATSGIQQGNDSGDMIGNIRLDLKNEILRRPADQIMQDITNTTANIGGIKIHTHIPRAGPTINKAIQIQLSSNDISALEATFYNLRDQIYGIDGLINFDDSTPKPGIDWIYDLHAHRLEQYKISTSTLGSMLQMITKGYKVGAMRTDKNDEEMDIIIRLPLKYRTLAQINSLKINSTVGLVPIDSLIKRSVRPSSDIITREDGERIMHISADVRPGMLADNILNQIKSIIANTDIPSLVRIEYKGEEEKQNESKQFLLKAFVISLFTILIVLLIQFNSFMQSLLVLSSIIMSTIGVLLGHLIIQKPFSIVMSGIGVIALAGIVINNNIILIDTFNRIKHNTSNLHQALLDAGLQRLRPVLLTSITTSLGMLPAVLQTKVDFIAREFSLGGATGQWWHQLSASIFYGLIFATILTLLFTPCVLYLIERKHWLNFLTNNKC